MEDSIMNNTQKEKVELLIVELKKLNCPANIFELLNEIVSPAKRNKESYLMQVFGTEKPVIGQIASFDYIQLRGKNGERLQENETAAQFMARMNCEVDFKHDNKSLNDIRWYLEKQGYITKKDNEAKTFTLLAIKTKEEVEEDAKVANEAKLAFKKAKLAQETKATAKIDKAKIAAKIDKANKAAANK